MTLRRIAGGPEFMFENASLIMLLKTTLKLYNSNLVMPQPTTSVALFTEKKVSLIGQLKIIPKLRNSNLIMPKPITAAALFTKTKGILVTP